MIMCAVRKSIISIVVKDTYKYMNAVRVYEAYQQGTHEARPETSVLEGHRHGEDAGPQTALDQVKQGPHRPGVTYALVLWSLST